jgi:hypothetical protein
VTCVTKTSLNDFFVFMLFVLMLNHFFVTPSKVLQKAEIFKLNSGNRLIHADRDIDIHIFYRNGTRIQKSRLWNLLMLEKGLTCFKFYQSLLCWMCWPLIYWINQIIYRIGLKIFQLVNSWDLMTNVWKILFKSQNF